MEPEPLLNGTPASDSFLPPITLPLDANLWQAGVNPLLDWPSASAEDSLTAYTRSLVIRPRGCFPHGSWVADCGHSRQRRANRQRPHARGSARHVRVSRRVSPEAETRSLWHWSGRLVLRRCGLPRRPPRRPRHEQLLADQLVGNCNGQELARDGSQFNGQSVVAQMTCPPGIRGSRGSLDNFTTWGGQGSEGAARIKWGQVGFLRSDELIERFDRLDGCEESLDPQRIEVILNGFRWIFQS